MCPSKAGLNKLIDEKLRTKERWSLNADTVRQLSCNSCLTRYLVQKSEQQALSQKDAKHQSHLGKVREGTSRHLVMCVG